MSLHLHFFLARQDCLRRMERGDFSYVQETPGRSPDGLSEQSSLGGCMLRCQMDVHCPAFCSLKGADL